MSHILSTIIKKKLPQWNERIFNNDDLPLLASETKVGLIEAPIKHKGEYTCRSGFPIIVLKQSMPRALQLWVGLHEIGHHLLHYPTAHRFSKSIYSKSDSEANFFAAIAMMPTELCRIMTPAEIAEHYGYPTEIIEIRRLITENFGQ